MQSRWISLHWLIEPHSLAANQPLEMLASQSYRHPLLATGWGGTGRNLLVAKIENGSWSHSLSICMHNALTKV